MPAVAGQVLVKGDETGRYKNHCEDVPISHRNMHVYDANHKWACNLHTRGEASVVKVGKNKKTGNCGTTMMFIGYLTDRESDSVKMWDSTTN